MDVQELLRALPARIEAKPSIAAAQEAALLCIDQMEGCCKRDNVFAPIDAARRMLMQENATYDTVFKAVRFAASMAFRKGAIPEELAICISDFWP